MIDLDELDELEELEESKGDLSEYKDILNEDQYNLLVELYDEIIKVFNGGFGTNIASIQGAAGTGKTFLLSIIIKEISKSHKVRVTAPTHKACMVLKSKLKEFKVLNGNVSVSTIHSYLKLKLQNNLDTGITELIEDSFNNDKNKKVDLLIIDESSMVSQQLYDYSLKRLDKGDIKFVLFSGDIYQLPPVDNTSDAMPIMEVHNNFKLEKIVRQAQESEVIQQSQLLKKHIEANDFKYIEELFKDCKQEIISIYDQKEFINHYLQNPITDKVILSYTNESVNQYNFGIRKTIRGDVQQFVVGEEVIFNESYNPKNSDFPIYANNDIIIIGHAELKYHETYKINYWTLNETITDELGKQTLSPDRISVVDKGSLEYYYFSLQELAKQAKVAQGHEKKTKWAQYFELKNMFADVRYTYSTTLHKSQGSTYKAVYINVKSLEKMINFIGFDIVYRLLYVGITRTSDKVYLLRTI